MVEAMTENKRFNTLLSRNGKYKYIDDKERILADRHGQIQGYLIQEDHEENVDLLVKFLNHQEQSIQQWRKSNDCFADKLETAEKEIQQLKERNQRQYYSLKKISDLMYARDWKALESIVEDWEESDRLLQQEIYWCFEEDPKNGDDGYG